MFLRQRFTPALFVLVAGCEVVAPSNPFDPEAPLDVQAPSSLAGTVVLQDPFDDDSRALALSAIRVSLLDDSGRRVQDNGVDVAVTLIDIAAAGEGRSSGRFVFDERPAGSTTVVIDRAPALYQPPALPTVRLTPGGAADVGELVYTFVGSGDDGPGTIAGEVRAVGGASGQHRVTLFQQRAGTVVSSESVVTDGAFSFDALGFGTYAVVVESEGFTPVYRLGVQVAAQEQGEARLQHQFAGDDALIVHPVTAALSPQLGDPTVVLDEGLVFVRGDVAPLVVLPFVTQAALELGITGMRLSTSSSFLDVDGAALPFVAHQASASVPLPSTDGVAQVFAQFEARSADNAFAFVSPTVSIQVVKDTTPPEVVEVTALGLTSDGAGGLLSSSRTLSVRVDANDATSAVDAVGVAFDDTAAVFDDVTAAPGLQRVQKLLTADADGSTELFVAVDDRAGNRSAVVRLPVTIDTVAPAIALNVDGADDGFLRSRVAGLDVDSLIDGDDDLLIAVGLEGAVNEADVGPVGPRTVVLPANLSHGASVTLQAVAFDVVGNRTSVTRTLILDLRGSVVGVVLSDAAPAVIESVVGARVTLTDSRGAPVGAPVVVDGGGGFSFADVPEDAGAAVRVDLDGHAGQTVRNVAVFADSVTELGDVTLALARGEVRGRALRSDVENDGAAHAGITVSLRLVSSSGRLFADTVTTDAAGNYSFRDVPRTLTGESLALSAQATDYGSAAADAVLVGGLVDVEPLLLPRVRGDFDACRTADLVCTPAQFFSADSVDLKLRDATDVTALHVGLNGAAALRLPIGPGNRTTVSLAGLSDGEVLLAVQAEKSDGSRSEALSATIVRDTAPPTGVSVIRRPSALARDARFTNAGFVDVDVTADAGAGVTAPLGTARVVLADSAPPLPTAGFAPCAHAVTCRVPLPDQERLFRLFVFSCDAAGNCAEPEETFVVRDTTPPTTQNGALFSVSTPGSVVEADVTVLRSPFYAGVIDTGAARSVSGVAVVDDAGAAVADVFGFRFSLSATNLQNAAIQSFADVPLPSEVKDGADISVPALPAGDAERTVFAQFVDAAGNLSQEQLSVRVVVDTTGPVAVLTVNAALPTATASVPFALVVPAGAEAPRRIELVVDDGAPQAFVLPLTGAERLALPVVEGLRRVTMNAFDRVDNATRTEVSVVLDQSVPRVDAARCTSVSCVDTGFGELSSRAVDARVDLSVTAFDALTSVSSVELSSVPAVPGGTQLRTIVGGVVTGVLIAANTNSTLSIVPVDAVGNRGAAFVRAVRHDVTGPTVTAFTIEAGAARTNKTQVAVQTTTAADDAVELRLATTTSFSGAFSPFRADEFFTFAGADGDRQVCVEVRDAAGNTSAACDSITLDRTPPTGTIGVAAAITSALSTTATLTYPADTSQVASSTSALSCDPATTNYAAATGSPQTVTIGLAGGDGVRTLFACFRDSAGNVAQDSTSITVDRTAPVATLTLNGGAAFATTTTPTALVTASGDSDALAVSVDQALSCATASYGAFSTSPTVTLPSAQGPHTVRVCVRDTAGNVSVDPAVAVITLDTVRPSATVSINGGAAFSRQSAVTLSVTASGDTTQLAVGNAATLDCNTASYASFAPTTTHQLSAGDGPKTVSVCVKDAAGLLSAASAADTITVDTTAPIGLLTVAGGAETTSVATVNAVLSGQSADVADVFVTAAPIACDTAAFQPLGGVTTFEVTLSLPNTSNVVTACLRDGAGNISAVTDTIFFENAAGDSLIVAIDGGAAAARSRAVTVSLFRPSTDFDQMKVLEAPNLDCADLSGYEAFNGAKALTLSSGTAPAEGQRTVSACVRATSSGLTRGAADNIFVDTFAPAGSVVVNGGAITSNATVTATLVNAFATDGELVTVALAEVSTVGAGGLCSGSFEAFAAARSFTFTDDDGVKTLFACLRDGAGNTTEVQDSITLDRAPPSPVSIAVPPLTSSTTISVALTFPVDAVQVALAEGALDCATTQTYQAVPPGPSPSRSLTLAAADGTRSIAACFKDAAGNTSQATATTNLDRSAPAGAVIIDGGAVFSTDLTVSVAVQNAADAVAMARVESAVAVDCAAQSFVPFVSPLDFALSATDGAKTVQVCLQDAAGNRALALPDGIVVDRTVPNGSVSINDAATATANRNVTLSIGTGGNVDVASFAAAEGSITCNASNLVYQPFASLVPFLLSSSDDTKTVLVCLKDQAGNVSSVASSDTIALDSAPPAGAVISVVDGDGFLNAEANIGLTVGWTTAGDVASVKVSEGAVDCQSGSGYVTVSAASTSTAIANFPISAGDGTKLVLACLRDAAGNVTTAQDTTLRDSTAPLVTSSTCVDCLSDAGTLLSRSPNVVLAVTSDEAGSGLASARVSVDAGAEVAATLQNGTIAVNALAQGSRTVRVKLVDRAGNVSATSRDVVIVVDQTAPVLAQLLLNGSNAAGNATNSRTVALSIIGASSDTAQMSIVDGDGSAPQIANCDAATYAPFVPELARTLTSSDGPKAVSVCLRDRAGNTSAAVTTTTIAFDSLPVSLPAIPVAIQDGDGFLQAETVITVRLSWTTNGDARQAKVQEGSVDCGSATGYVTLPVNANTFDVTNVGVSPGDGQKVVGVCFKDAAGNVVTAQDATLRDATLPTGALVVASGAQKTRLTTGVAVTVSSIDGDLTQMAIVDVTTGSTQSCANGSYGAFSTTGALAAFASTTNQTKTVGLCLRDRAGNQTTTPAGTDTIVLDNALVATGATVSLLGTRKDGIVDGVLTRTPVVTLELNGVAADVVGIEIANDSTFFAAVDEIFGNGVVYPFQLDPGDGAKDVFVRLTDDAGNQIVLANNNPAGVDLGIRLDTTPPSAPLLILQSGEVFTRVTTVPAVLVAQPVGVDDGALEVRVSANDFDFADVGETFTTTIPNSVVVNAGDGTKTVIAQFRDQAGNETAVVTDAIDLDATRPAPTADVPCGGSNQVICINQAAAFTNSVSANVQISSSLATGDRFTNAVEMQIATDGSADGEPFIPYVSSVTVVLPSGEESKTVAVRFKDAAGNVSVSQFTDTITLDTVAPTAPRIATGSSVVDAASVVVDLAVDAADTNFRSYQLRNGGGAFVDVVPDAPACITNGSTCSFTVTLIQNAENRIAIRAQDTAGNVSPDDFLVVREDGTAPLTPATLTARPGDRSIELSWTASTSTDVAGYRIYYRIDDDTSANCSGVLSTYTGVFADQGPSFVDVGLNTSTTLTGLSNNVPVCVGVTAYDGTTSPAPNESSGRFSTATVPSTLPLVLGATLSAAQLGISGNIRGLAHRDGLLYVAANASGLVELDVGAESCFAITDPTSFAECTGQVRSVETLSAPGEIVLHGAFAFVVDTGAVKVFRIASGTAPSLAFTLSTRHSGAALSTIRGLATERSLLVAGHSSGATVWDLNPLYAATPLAPTTLSDFGGTSAVFDVDLQDGIAALTSGFFSLANPAVPAVQPICQGFGVITTLKIAGKMAYGGNTSSSLVVCDRSVLDGSFHPATGIVPFANFAKAIAMVGPYVVGVGQGKVEVLDASNRDDLRPAGTFTSTVGGTADGTFAVDGNRLFLSSEVSSSLQMIYLGEARSLERIGSEASVTLQRGSLIAGDLFLNGEAQAVHLGREDAEVDLERASPILTENIATENNTFVSFRGCCATSGASLAEFSRNVAGISTPANMNTGGYFPNGGAVRWPFAISAGNNATSSATTSSVRVHDLRSNTQVTSLTIVTGSSLTNGPARLALYGDDIYVATGGTGGGITRVPFNPLTGTLGTAELVEAGNFMGIVAYGRRLVFWVEAAAMRINRMVTPTWSSANVAVVGSILGPSRFSKPALAGEFWVLPGNSNGFKFVDVSYATTAPFQATSATQTFQLGGGSAFTAAVAGDRVYLTRVARSLEIFSFR